MLAAIVVRIQAVVAELANIDECDFSVREFH
jgi:hypothetical protein